MTHRRRTSSRHTVKIITTNVQRCKKKKEKQLANNNIIYPITMTYVSCYSIQSENEDNRKTINPIRTSSNCKTIRHH